MTDPATTVVHQEDEAVGHDLVQESFVDLASRIAVAGLPGGEVAYLLLQLLLRHKIIVSCLFAHRQVFIGFLPPWLSRRGHPGIHSGKHFGLSDVLGAKLVPPEHKVALEALLARFLRPLWCWEFRLYLLR